jgi:hypothetical protein
MRVCGDPRSVVKCPSLPCVQGGVSRQRERFAGPVSRAARRCVWAAGGHGDEGGLRWPFRPFQVICVLVVLVPTAAYPSTVIFRRVAVECSLREASLAVLVNGLRIENALLAQFERNRAGLAQLDGAIKT